MVDKYRDSPVLKKFMTTLKNACDKPVLVRSGSADPVYQQRCRARSARVGGSPKDSRLHTGRGDNGGARKSVHVRHDMEDARTRLPCGDKKIPLSGANLVISTYFQAIAIPLNLRRSASLPASAHVRLNCFFIFLATPQNADRKKTWASTAGSADRRHDLRDCGPNWPPWSQLRPNHVNTYAKSGGKMSTSGFTVAGSSSMWRCTRANRPI